MSETLYQLTVRKGPKVGETFILETYSLTIGRDPVSDVVLNDPEVSRQHARFTQTETGYQVQDLGSTNGTFVNGIRQNQPTSLKHGDSIEFGDTVRLRYWAAGMPSEMVYSPVDDVPTPALPPEPAPLYAQPGSFPDYSPTSSPDLNEFEPPETAVSPNRNRILIGCGCLLVLACVLCAGTVFFLDSYQQGQLLYCGGLRPFWETVLGPLGFNPICP